jgi:ADP-ribose pyrophosphatase YjhB (NUDIX family)
MRELQGSAKAYEQLVIMGAVVVFGARALILQPSATNTANFGQWELPSSLREPYEPPHSALQRAVREETGLHVRVIGPLATCAYQIDRVTTMFDIVQITYLVSASSTELLELSDAHQAAAWVTRTGLVHYPMCEATRAVLSEAFCSILRP